MGHKYDQASYLLRVIINLKLYAFSRTKRHKLLHPNEDILTVKQIRHLKYLSSRFSLNQRHIPQHHTCLKLCYIYPSHSNSCSPMSPSVMHGCASF